MVVQTLGESDDEAIGGEVLEKAIDDSGWEYRESEDGNVDESFNLSTNENDVSSRVQPLFIVK